MDTLINLLIVANFIMFVGWIVAAQAKRDREYTAAVRAEQKRKDILRGRRDD
ncbi:MAG: hypothetical protein AAFR53_11230 [Pseudomonadota bacterium]